MLPYRVFCDDVLAYYPDFRLSPAVLAIYDEMIEWFCQSANIEFTYRDIVEADAGSVVNIEFTDSDDDDDGASVE